MARPHASVTLDEVLELARELSPIDQVRLIEQVASAIETKLTGPKANPRTSLLGLVKDLGPAPSAEEIDEARGEAWSNFGQDVSSCYEQ